MDFEWHEDPTDWKDSGRRVEVQSQDGSVHQGVLEIVDQTPGPDEVPIFEVVADDGSDLSIYSAKRWRFL